MQTKFENLTIDKIREGVSHIVKKSSAVYVYTIPNLLLATHVKTGYKTSQLKVLMAHLSSLFLELGPQVLITQDDCCAKYKITIQDKYYITMIIYANKKDTADSSNLIVEFDKFGYSTADKMLVAKIFHYIKQKLLQPDVSISIPDFNSY